jgi:hypothetical protein
MINIRRFLSCNTSEYKVGVLRIQLQCSPDITLSFIPRIRIYRGSFLFPVSLKEILRKNMEVAAADLALQEAFPLK